jgi:hypothetical protein
MLRMGMPVPGGDRPVLLGHDATRGGDTPVKHAGIPLSGGDKPELLMGEPVSAGDAATQKSTSSHGKSRVFASFLNEGRESSANHALGHGRRCGSRL